MTLRELADQFARLDLDAVAAQALAEQSTRVADAVREALSQPPGAAHEFPWLQSGALRDSIRSESDASEAIVASTSDVALYQEFGTATLPPRPFLAPIAALHAEEAADAVGAAFAHAIEA